MKRIARELLEKLQALGLEHCRQKQQTRAALHSEIRFKLNELPEETYPERSWGQKVETVWQFVDGQPQGTAGSAAAAYWR